VPGVWDRPTAKAWLTAWIKKTSSPDFHLKIQGTQDELQQRANIKHFRLLQQQE
jgi:hypothetical protein